MTLAEAIEIVDRIKDRQWYQHERDALALVLDEARKRGGT